MTGTTYTACEIARCEIRCANSHRQRTRARLARQLAAGIQARRPGRESNARHTDSKSVALSAELPGPLTSIAAQPPVRGAQSLILVEGAATLLAIRIGRFARRRLTEPIDTALPYIERMFDVTDLSPSTEQATRTCRRCGETKALDQFDVRADYARPRWVCRGCRRAYQRRRYAGSHPATHGARRRRSAGAATFICSRCRITRPVSEFPPVHRGGDRLQSWCRACFAEVNARNYAPYYQRERGRIQARVGLRREELRRHLVEYLLIHPCVDCGERDIVVLEFDHIADKLGNVSALASGGRTWEFIKAEIDKCEVRCANCHRRVTYARRNARRSQDVVADTQVQRSLRGPTQLLLDCVFEIRVCRDCGEAGPLSDFPFRSIEAQTRQWHCKSCQRAYSGSWYVRNRTRHIANTGKNAAAQKRRGRAMVRTYLREHPCVDCGEPDPEILEFDHVRGKSAEISFLVSAGRPWATVLAEIGRCEVRCANCHRRETVRRCGGYRLRAKQLRGVAQDANAKT